MQPLASSNLTGIGTYTKEVARRLAPNLEKGGYASVELHVFDFLKRNGGADFVRQHLDKPASDCEMKECHLMPLGLYNRLGKMGSIVPYEKLLKTDNDITLFFNFLVPMGLKGKSIITVHDMVSSRYPEMMDARNKRLLTRCLPASCEKAETIMVVSEFTKQEVIDCLGVPEEKIRVAYCGVNSRIYSPCRDDRERKSVEKRVRGKWNIPGEYILYLGTLEPRKNVGRLVEAFEMLKKDHPDLKLVIGGGLGWKYESLLEKIETSPFASDIIRTGYLSESDKIDLYRIADVFVFPSVYEGFGIPALEAMACGTPAVVSRAASLPEVVGDAGYLADPQDASSFAEGIEIFLSKKYDKATLDTKMKAQVDKFSWDATTLSYGQAIYDVIK